MEHFYCNCIATLYKVYQIYTKCSKSYQNIYNMYTKESKTTSCLARPAGIYYILCLYVVYMLIYFNIVCMYFDIFCIIQLTSCGWEGATKGKICCMVFKVEMYNMFSKCTKDCQTNTTCGQQVLNILNKCKHLIFRKKQIFEKLHGPYQSWKHHVGIHFN